MNRVKKCRYGEMIYQTNDAYIGRSLDLYGEFSEGEAELFARLVQPGDTVIDVGANIGAHTVALAQFVGPKGRVFAFEPQRILYYCLCGNVALNNLSNTWCHQAAAGPAPGTIKVPELNYAADNNFGGLGLDRDFRNIATYTVPLIRIDDMKLARCRLIKADVEGMEKKVLEGAVELIRAHRPMLYVEDDREEKSAELRTFIDSLGYVMYTHRPPLFNPRNYLGNAQNVFGQIISLNLFCHPRETAPPILPADFGMVPVTAPGPVTTNITCNY